MSEAGSEEHPGGGRDAPFLEWVLAAAGVMVAFGIVGYLAVVGLTSGSGPADLRPRELRTVEQHGSHLVLVEVENAGDGPAADILVQGRLFDDGNEIQSSEITIDYVPVGSTSEAVIVFTEPPSQFELQLRILGYRTP